MAMRDFDIVSTFLKDKRTVMNKMNVYANQVTDPSLKSLIQDCANIHNRHVQMLSQTQNRIGMPGQIPGGVTQPAYTGAQWGTYQPVSS